MAVETVISPEVERRVREIVREELIRTEWPHGRREWSREKMVAAIERLREARKGLSFPPGAVDALIEEHRREIGRGPLVDEPDDVDAG